MSTLIGTKIRGATRTLRSRKAAPLEPSQRKMVGAKTPTAPSALEEAFALQVRAAKLPAPVREHRFHPTRRWRFDFAWPVSRIAVEIEGGTWSGGRHTRGSGFEADCIKYNAAAVLDWRVLRVTGSMVKDGSALAAVRQLLSETLRG
ncbi:hypothetical protein AWB76_03266 [Caballeronia temeraria]|uniref:DUF559 domain-containing protein n=1 Tax=Caballeronia temeraria TaxID=1777137 RepID=A0A158AXW1_9BURK|nr:hypothetical protein [Caballeronia temeraria]SAK62549.1 hypothetical protein AWB76_03266 [Caballeronia temeraria]